MRIAITFYALTAFSGAVANEAELVGPSIVQINGEITKATEASFLRILEHEDISSVELNSEGGQVYAALSIADQIHAQGIDTWIRPNNECHSACALIFLAGERRLADGLLGVHQFRTDEQDNSLTQLVVSDIYSSLSSYGTPDELISVMLRTPSDDMYVFSREEIERLGLSRLQVEVELSHLQVVTSNLHQDWLVGTFLNTHTAQPFYAMESRELEPVFRIVHYPGRSYAFGELIWHNRRFQPGATHLRFVFERDRNEHGESGTMVTLVQVDLDDVGYSWDFMGGQLSVNFMNAFIYGHRLRIEDFSGRTIALFSLSGTRKATSDFIALMQ